MFALERTGTGIHETRFQRTVQLLNTSVVTGSAGGMEPERSKHVVIVLSLMQEEAVAEGAASRLSA